MNRITDRSVELTEFEVHMTELAEEDWQEGTDPQTFILDEATKHGEVVSQEFVDWLANRLIINSTHGFAIGTPFAGSTIADIQIENENEVSLDLADGRVVLTRT